MTNRNHDPDYLLAEENFDVLNSRFYGSRPALYFQQRFVNALLVAGRLDEMRDVLREGIDFGYLSLPPDSAEVVPILENDEAATLFLISESQVLLHHVVEVLLRLFLAHEGFPPCPWLELARLRSFREFKKRVRERFLKPLPDDGWRIVDILVFGAETLEMQQAGIPQEIRRERAERALGYLGFMAGLYLDGAHIYNSAKHGMAILGNPEAVMKLGDAEKGPVVQRSGTGVDSLLIVDDDGRKKWATATDWVSIGLSLELSHLAVFMIENLWSVAQEKYIGTAQRPVFSLKMPAIDNLFQRGEPAFERSTWTLKYFRSENDRTLIPGTGYLQLRVARPNSEA